MVDREDDLKVGVKSTAILFGRWDRRMIALTHFFSLVLLVQAGLMAKLGIFYYSGLVVAAVIAIYQQFLIYRREAKQCFKAFLNNNWFGAAVFTGLVLNYLVAK